MSAPDAAHLLGELQEARAEIDILRRFRRAVLVAYDHQEEHGPGQGVDFALQMILEIDEEYKRKFGPLSGEGD